MQIVTEAKGLAFVFWQKTSIPQARKRGNYRKQTALKMAVRSRWPSPAEHTNFTILKAAENKLV